ncbi:hypothetical protein AB0I28_24350 [Phytomonospora sp. NPDC050363]|uniref:hypothetical protein n=1 Tax=Phytomonospora sp. NPDC050363 TaxID=3155642 RepID=UPI0033DB6170
MGIRKHSTVRVDRPADVLIRSRPHHTGLGDKVTKLFAVAAFKLTAAGLEKSGERRRHGK